MSTKEKHTVMKPFFEEEIKSATPTLIVFIHAAEQDAVEVKYLADALKKEYGDKLNVQRVDVSYNHHVAEKYRLSEYPTWIIFKDGDELMRESGIKTLNKLTEMVNRVF